jgi:hypothetical protein
MTVPVRNPQQKFREDAVTPMEVLSLYTDPILPELADTAYAPRHECRVFMHPAIFLGHNTHPYRVSSGSAKSPTPKGT